MPNTTDVPRFHSVAEAAAVLTLSKPTIRAHIRLGNIAVTRFGARVAIPGVELKRVASVGLPRLQAAPAKPPAKARRGKRRRP